MSLAHLLAQPVVERRGVLVRPLGEWEEGVHLTHPAPKLVLSTCLELNRGITSDTVAELTGIPAKAASTYLGRLRKDGILEVERVIRGLGRPTLVYRVAR